MFIQQDALLQSLVVAFLFCCASSAVYIVNDLQDRERDRLHPVKAVTRPLASGAVSVPEALVLLAVLYAILAIGWFFQPCAAIWC